MMKFRNRLSQVEWEEILDSVNVDEDYNRFIKKFRMFMMTVYHLRNVLANQKSTTITLDHKRSSAKHKHQKQPV